MALRIGELFSLFLLINLEEALQALPLEFAPEDEGITYNEVEQLLSLNRAARQGEDTPASISESQLNIADKLEVPKEVKNWPVEDLILGQVTGVAVNSAQQPVIFHRAERVWDGLTFNSTNYYLQAHLGPIKDPTILTLDPHNGSVIGKWGADKFYLPHGLTIDRHDNLWITDVGMHQAFKFKPGEQQPTLIFGELLVPGSDVKHLCKPTSIAVATTGEIFIADGYCNSRILKYNAAGGLLKIIPNPSDVILLQVPHSLALIETMDRLCIADRESMRVVCPRAGLYSLKGKKDNPLTIQQPDMGRLFAVAAKGRLIYAVNGPTNQLLPVQGLTLDPESESVIDHWAPEEGFNNPHDIAVNANGSALYVVEIGPNKVWKFELVPPKK
ncbi:peptidyl-alpha-hydroxyglycine alpha-amidating lyase 2-like isoform X1 [Euwallacea similis]|uniref:peptidyl-alpha-hydroxyglycine alpha-amidating lyase 2-like isoform X1 n=1 Tax=Euwallacea similis TaxID=1736056 RepID=UPI00344DBBA9